MLAKTSFMFRMGVRPQVAIVISTLVVAAVVWGVLIGSGRAQAADVLVGRKVPAASRIAMQQLRHDRLNTLLQKYVDDRGMVDYRGWKASPEDLRQLDAYLAELSSVKTAGGERPLQIAYWINAYNAVTLQGMLREYPTSSIRNHTAKVFGYNIWKNLKLQVDGRQLSLEDIEHKILRKAGEPRIHFAIVCASIGCPRLLPEAYTAEKLDAQLTLNTKSFFADPTKFRFNSTSGKMQLSPILNWFGADFGKDQTQRLKTIGPYLPAAAQDAYRQKNVTVSYLDYDWDLNAQR